ncbi:MAG: GlxA family transcriptional regulator [Acidimicrobiales bacterium]
MRQVVVCVVPEEASLFELATPSAVWGPHRSANCDTDVEFVPCGVSQPKLGVEGQLSISGLELLADHVERADLVVVPTWPITDRSVDPALIDLLVQAHGNGAKLAGLCLGAFAIAATGLLDGRSATTHWRQRQRFEWDYPGVRFEANTLYVDEGDVITSAGSAAALDCCLHLLRTDHGAEAAAVVARSLVTAPHRTGAQSQFASSPAIDHGDDPISEALSQAAEDIRAITGVNDLVALAKTSRRSLERHFRERLGISPGGWIDEQRIITACRLLETTDLAIDLVADSAGYGSTPTLRRAMQRKRSTTPTAYRAAFKLRA